MKIVPRDYKETMNLVYNILNQGDSRYNDPEKEVILTDFLIKEAIDLEEREIPKIDLSGECNKPNTNLGNVQWSQKKLAVKLLRKEGFQDSEIYLERRFLGSQPDVMAESGKRTIIVECCSCRIDKIINFLSDSDEVWILTYGQDPNEEFQYLNSKMQWLIFKKGENWQEVFSEFQKKCQEQLKKIKSPIDKL